MLKGVDVSKRNGVIDWQKVKTDFCIIRAGYGKSISQKDPTFEVNYAGCKAQGRTYEETNEPISEEEEN